MVQDSPAQQYKALLTDFMPYEVPIGVSMEGIYRFLRLIDFNLYPPKNKNSDRYFNIAQKANRDVAFGWLENIFDSEVKSENGKLLISDCDWSVPYKYTILQPKGDDRVISFLHPRSAVFSANFMATYRDSIIHYCGLSKFSIRYPCKVSKKNSYRRNFFDYRRYNNINSFYGSTEFRACERKYSGLLKVDVSRCFESMYTHAMEWAVEGKHFPASARNTFGWNFDLCMRNTNGKETKGIPVGSEFSRLFAEMILQRVDINLEVRLKDLKFGSDYEIMRYVDDYFIFVSDPQEVRHIESALAACLEEYRLQLNPSKRQYIRLPFEDNVSVAKTRLSESIEKRLNSGKFTSKDMILDYKSVLIDTGVNASSVASYYLSELMRRIRLWVKSNSSEKCSFLHASLEIIDVLFFVYSGAPCASHAIKLVNSIRTLYLMLADKDGVRPNNNQERLLSASDIYLLEAKIARELRSQLCSRRDEESFGLHTLLLLQCLIAVSEVNGVSAEYLRELLKRRRTSVEELDAFGVLVFLSTFAYQKTLSSDFKEELIGRAEEIISMGKHDSKYHTQRAILRLSLPSMPTLKRKDLKALLVDNDLDRKYAKYITKTPKGRIQSFPSLFDWTVASSIQSCLSSTSFESNKFEY
ncbi:RNA-directed DNA polymerase [Dermabacteraceae bacterium P13088]